MAEKYKIKDLFTPSGCLSKQGLTWFIEGSLDPEEQKLADLHIGTCELCADAVNGYKQHTHYGTAIPVIHELNRKLHMRFLNIHQRTVKERSMVPVFSVAATIILLAGIFLLLKQREVMTEKTLAEARHDSVMAPAPQFVQPAASPEGEFSAPSVKKPVAGKEKKQKETANAGAASTMKTAVAESDGVAEMKAMTVLPDEEDIQDSGAAIPEFMTETVIIRGPNVGRNAQPSPSASYSAASKKSSRVRAEAVLTGQDAVKPVAEQKDEAFIAVEDMPTFMDGDISRFLTYVQESIGYPAEAAEAGIEGRVVLNFVVDETGKLTDARIISPADPLINAEALRVVTSSPLWKPGMQRGRPVKVGFTIPIVFSLQ